MENTHENKKANELEQAKQKADTIFTAYSDIDEVYITSDLQGFTDEIRAENHADTLKDKKIHHFQRTSDFEAPNPEDAEKEALLEEYEQLFGSKAPHNIGTKKLREKIAEKKKQDATPVENKQGEEGENVESDEQR